MANVLKKKAPKPIEPVEPEKLIPDKPVEVSVKEVVKDERSTKIVGTSCILFSLFLFCSLTSYLFTWQDDQDKVFRLGIKIFTDSSAHARNIFGWLGAYTAHLFIYDGFGIASFLLCTTFFVIGANLLFEKRVYSLARNLKYVIVGLTVFSTFFAYVMSNSSFSWGGAVGEMLTGWLEVWVGSIGTAIVLFAAFSAYIIWRFNPIFNYPAINWKSKLNSLDFLHKTQKKEPIYKEQAKSEPITNSQIKKESEIIQEEQDPFQFIHNRLRPNPNKLVVNQEAKPENQQPTTFGTSPNFSANQTMPTPPPLENKKPLDKNYTPPLEFIINNPVDENVVFDTIPNQPPENIPQETFHINKIPSNGYINNPTNYPTPQSKVATTNENINNINPVLKHEQKLESDRYVVPNTEDEVNPIFAQHEEGQLFIDVQVSKPDYPNANNFFKVDDQNPPYKQTDNYPKPTINNPQPAPHYPQPTTYNLQLTTNNPQPSTHNPQLEIKKAVPNDTQAEQTSLINAEELLDLYEPKNDLSNYKYPSTDLLEQHGSEKIIQDPQELENHKNQIVDTLKNYDIAITRIAATVGPTVTLYEIVPAPGVRISRIKNLEDDIALSLAALGIRIIAPIPGRGTIGIEVPNVKKSIVSMKTLLSSEKFQSCNFSLPIAIGKKIDNENFIVDLASMPHLLMAGATGQGKSVGINAVLVSLLYKKHPAQLKFVLVDPKKVELSLYKVIEKHFLAKLPGEEESIITDTKKVVSTLNALCIEMDNRYDLLKDAGCRNIKEYNEKFVRRRLNPQKGHNYLPFIVLVVDEFADLIMTAGKEVEQPIARLAQLARAIGIHLIIATQRPSVNIITGTIKANFPARVAFKVSSKIDSRTILDHGGADQLIGKGDMLISYNGEIVRLQCAFVDTPEVERVCNFIGDQHGYPEAFLLPEFVDDKDGENRDSDNSGGDRDPLFEEAARLIVQNQMGSTSLIQRRMKLGYNRAGRLMDQLERAGIVGPNLGSKAREVRFQSEMELEQYLDSIA